MLETLGNSLVGFVIGLGFLIFVHEAGHFMVAKLFHVRVLVFSFGFGKRLFGFHRGDTDYRVSLIPLGGYVRMAGDNPEEEHAGSPDEFLSKPKWQRFLILVAGPAMNILIAIGFFTVMYMVGVREPVTRPVVGAVVAGQPAEKAGLQKGDRILRIAGEPIEQWDDLRLMISTNAGTAVLVEFERNGKRMTTTLTPTTETGDYGPVGRAGVAALEEPVIRGLQKGTAAAAAGLRVGDRIVAVDGKPVALTSDLEVMFDPARTKPVPLTVLRAGKQILLTIAAAGKNPPENYPGFGVTPTELRKFSFLPAVRESVKQNWKLLKLAGRSLRRLFRTEGSVKELSGPIAIARFSGEAFRSGLMPFMSFVALISLQLGVMNLLPIPMLDGGHIMILLIEGIARRDLSLRVKERIQQLGFAVLAMLMIVVIYNDVIASVLRFRKG